ncbi:MAG TPA: hypothetical protein VED19_01630, partial [Candidatus Nitrosopolaris sp.]|nr:hypothetical protein [Candidatus Nitrosopolaris sp.]
LSFPAGLAFNANGNLFVSCQTAGDIIAITPGGSESVLFSGLNTPNGIAFDSAGNLFVANTAGYNILKFTPSGTGSVFAGLSEEPSGLAFEPVPQLRAAVTNGAFQMTVTMPSPYYSTIMQASSDLVNWTYIYTNTPPYTCTNSLTMPQSFYRVVLAQ